MRQTLLEHPGVQINKNHLETDSSVETEYRMKNITKRGN